MNSSTSVLAANHSSFRSRLGQQLDEIESPAPFASFCELDTITDPQIYVGDHGPIGLPLSNDDAQVIIRASHQAPFGKGSETIVDSSVRNTWELNSEQFELRNSEWKNFMGHILAKISKELGLGSKVPRVDAELYKMLLYDKGAMFKAHQDSEKAPGMFGTLVVCLPSPHSGGDVKVKHAGIQKVFSTSKKKQSFLWWYSDVTHEVLEVVSGYRWVLTYNLVRNGTGSTLKAAHLDTIGLQNSLKLWQKALAANPAKNTGLVYLLDYQYTHANLKLSCLKNEDLDRALALRQACERAGFCFYLASLERKVWGGVYEEYDYPRYRSSYWDEEECETDESDGEFHTIEDILDDDYCLDSVFDHHGEKILTRVPISIDDIVQENPFEAEPPDEEDYQGFTGNEGANATHWYRRAAFLILPISGAVDFFLRSFQPGSRYHSLSHQDISGLIEHLENQFKRNHSVEFCKTGLQRTCQLVIDRNANSTYNPFSDETLVHVVKASLILVDLDLFTRSTAHFRKKLPSDLFLHMGKALDSIKFADMKAGLENSIARYTQIHELVKSLGNLLQGSISEKSLEKGNDSGLSWWILTKLESFLHSMKFVTLDDVPALLQLALTRQGTEYFFKKIIPVVQRHIFNTAFIVTFLNHLWETDRNSIPQDAVCQAFKILTPHIPIHFNLRKCSNSQTRTESGEMTSPLQKRPRYDWESLPSSKRSQTQAGGHLAEGKYLGTFLDHCFSLEMSSYAEAILDAFTLEIRLIDTADFSSTIFPFLNELISLLPKWNIPFTNPRYQKLFQQVLHTYVTRFVGKDPTKSPNWVRRPVKCTCGDCQWLNQFLVNPDVKVGRFPMDPGRRAHLHQQIGSDCIHETERLGWPQTLVVTKTSDGIEWAFSDWKKRKNEAKNLIRSLGEFKLRQLLVEKYGDITQLRVSKLLENEPATLSQQYVHQLQQPRHTRPSPTSGGASKLNPTSGNTRNVSRRLATKTAASSSKDVGPIGPRKLKRKADVEPEVIDLTGDN